MNSTVVCVIGPAQSGKTTLIHLLTNSNNDYNSHEQMVKPTIDLSVFYYEQEDRNKISIIDTPGASKYLKNLLSAFYCADIAIIVFSAQEQPVDQIADILNILDTYPPKQSIVILNKADMVSRDQLESIKATLEEHITEKYKQKLPLIEMDCFSKSGISELKHTLCSMNSFITSHYSISPVRIYIDRYFHKENDTIITGTLMSGSLTVGDLVEVSPLNLVTRIKSLQYHSQIKHNVQSKSRIGINLGDVPISKLKRGQVLVRPGMFKATNKVDCYIKLYPEAGKTLKNNAKIKVSIASNNLTAKVKLLDRHFLVPGEYAYARLQFNKCFTCCFYDKLALLNPLNNRLIGSGEILRVRPENLLRFDKEQIELLDFYRSRQIEEVVLALLENHKGPMKVDRIIKSLPYKDLDILERLRQKQKIIIFSDKVMLKSKFEEYQRIIKQRLKRLHKVNPSKIGYKVEYLSESLKINSEITRAVLNYLMKESVAKCNQNLYHLASHTVKVSIKDRILLTRMYVQLKTDLFVDDLKLKELGGEKALEIIEIELLNKKIIQITPEIYILPEKMQLIKAKIKTFLETNQQITPAQCRDLLNSSRKYIIPLLEYLDRVGYTRRVDGFRELN